MRPLTILVALLLGASSCGNEDAEAWEAFEKDADHCVAELEEARACAEDVGFDEWGEGLYMLQCIACDASTECPEHELFPAWADCSMRTCEDWAEISSWECSEHTRAEIRDTCFAIVAGAAPLSDVRVKCGNLSPINIDACLDIRRWCQDPEEYWP